MPGHYRLNASVLSNDYSIGRDLVMGGAPRISSSPVHLVLRPDFHQFAENKNVYVLAMVCANTENEAKEM